MFTSATPRASRPLKLTLALALTLIAGLALNVPAGFASDPTDPFYTTDELCKVTLTPASATNPVGGSQTLTAKIESTGVTPPIYYNGVNGFLLPCWRPPVPAVPGEELPPPYNIDFLALSGPNAGQSASVPVDVNWSASHTYSSQLAGTDVWQASAKLPQFCFVDYSAAVGWEDPVPPECQGQINTTSVCLTFDPCNPQPLPTTTIVSNTSPIEWTAPVVTQASPSVSVASTKRCHTPNKFRIRPSVANGQVSSMTLYVDGKKVRKVNGSTESFTINAAKYGPGSHSIKLVTKFTNGSSVTTTKTFNRCKARAVAKRTQPRFTG